MFGTRKPIPMPAMPAIFDVPTERRNGKICTVYDVQLRRSRNELPSLTMFTGVSPLVTQHILDDMPATWEDVSSINYETVLTYFDNLPQTFCTNVMGWVFGGMPVLVYDRQGYLHEKNTFISVYALLNGTPLKFEGYDVRSCYRSLSQYPAWVIGDPFLIR